MRYKQLVIQKLEQVENMLTVLNTILSQAKTREEYDNWQERVREKISEIQTLINSESE